MRLSRQKSFTIWLRHIGENPTAVVRQSGNLDRHKFRVAPDKTSHLLELSLLFLVEGMVIAPVQIKLFVSAAKLVVGSYRSQTEILIEFIHDLALRV